MMTTKIANTAMANFLVLVQACRFPFVMCKEMTVVLCSTQVSDYNLAEFLAKGVTVEHRSGFH